MKHPPEETEEFKLLRTRYLEGCREPECCQAQADYMQGWRKTTAGQRSLKIRSRAVAKASSWVIHKHPAVWKEILQGETERFDAEMRDNGPVEPQGGPS